MNAQLEVLRANKVKTFRFKRRKAVKYDIGNHVDIRGVPVADESDAYGTIIRITDRHIDTLVRRGPYPWQNAIQEWELKKYKKSGIPRKKKVILDMSS